MSIFGSILARLTGHANAAPATPAAEDKAAASPTQQPAAGAAAPLAAVDVEGILGGLAAKSGQPSNWRTSIVDLMKLLDLDSSLANRKALAQELHYTGSTEDSAAMNIWLHKQVMTKLAENGGKVSPDLMHH